MGKRGALLSYRRNDPVVKMKQNSDAVELSASDKGKLLSGLAISEPKASTASTTLLPSFTLPKIKCWPSNHSVLAVQMKNWEPFVLGPILAMEKMLGPEFYRMNSHHQISLHR